MNRIPLILAPTPLHRLDRMSEELGLDLWIKRDDLTGFVMGGNKGRKLEYLMGDVVAQGATAVVTCGSLQSNFIRQLAGACSMQGIRCVAAVMTLPYEDEKPSHHGLTDTGGNVLLGELLGVEFQVFPDGTWDELFDQMEALAQDLERSAERVYRIPVGGSSPVGAYAFYKAGEELAAQTSEPFDWIVVASSSGSTQTGMGAYFKGSHTKVQGIACDPEPEITKDFAELSEGLAPLIGAEQGLRPEEFRLNFDYVGPGYGVPSSEGMDAIRRLARAEGIFLDPIYSAKAFAGLIDLAQRGEIAGRVAFWHTGGTPALFAME